MPWGRNKQEEMRQFEQRVSRLYLAGSSVQQIANRIGCSSSKVIHALDRAGIRRRSRSEAQILAN